MSRSIVMSHQAPAASKATLVGPTPARARSGESKRSICQNTGSVRPSGSGLLSMMLQPISPRLSGESAAHLDINCAAAVFVVRIDNAAASQASRPRERVTIEPPCLCELILTQLRVAATSRSARNLRPELTPQKRDHPRQFVVVLSRVREESTVATLFVIVRLDWLPIPPQRRLEFTRQRDLRVDASAIGRSIGSAVQEEHWQRFAAAAGMSKRGRADRRERRGAREPPL